MLFLSPGRDKFYMKCGILVFLWLNNSPDSQIRKQNPTMTGRSFFSNIPPVTKNLIIINFIVWLFMMVAPEQLGARIDRLFALHYWSATHFNPAQLFTYMFMHSTVNFGHLLFNMFSLWMFGTAIERALGSWRFLFYYVSCGLGAAIVQELAWMWTWVDSAARSLAPLNPHLSVGEITELLNHPAAYGMASQVAAIKNSMITVGASGAIYGVLLAFGMLWPNRPLFLFFVPIPIKAKWMVLGFGVLEVLLGLSDARGLGDGIAHFAHLGGMIFGFIMIYYWRKKGLGNGSGFY